MVVLKMMMSDDDIYDRQYLCFLKVITVLKIFLDMELS